MASLVIIRTAINTLSLFSGFELMSLPVPAHSASTVHLWSSVCFQMWNRACLDTLVAWIEKCFCGYELFGRRASKHPSCPCVCCPSLHPVCVFWLINSKLYCTCAVQFTALDEWWCWCWESPGHQVNDDYDLNDKQLIGAIYWWMVACVLNVSSDIISEPPPSYRLLYYLSVDRTKEWST